MHIIKAFFDFFKIEKKSKAKQIRIDRANSINKGAELMLYSIVDRLKEFDVQFVLGKTWHTDERTIKRAGLSAKQNKVDIMLDAAGFRRSDQFVELYSKKITEKEIKDYKKLKKRGAKIVFLPQSFGPFENEIIRENMLGIFPYIDLIYAREQASYDYLVELFGKDEKIKMAPDFTNLLKPNLSEIDNNVLETAKDSVILIPNHKMCRKEEKYQEFLEKAVEIILAKNLKLVLLNHEGERDKKLIDEILVKYPDLKVLDDLDAISIKAAISQAKLVISSRYHGIISALCQNVPVLCTSWSHKYQELLGSYDMSDCCLDIKDETLLETKIAHMLENNNEIRNILFQKNNSQPTEKMWQEIIELCVL